MENTTQILADTKNLASKEATEKKLLKMKGSVNGAITGLVAGLMVGYFKKYNLVASGIAGIVLGSAIAYLLLKEKDEIINQKK